MREKFTVIVGTSNIWDDHKIIKMEEIYDQEKAESLAKKWAKEHSEVYIRYQRYSDGQVAYLNPAGYQLQPVNWAE